MKIETDYWLKPIPTKAFDWQAWDADTYDGEGCLIGHGATEAEAKLDLIEQLWENEKITDAEYEKLKKEANSC